MPPVPSGADWGIKRLSPELLWALDISTDMTFGFRGQFYGCLYGRDRSAEVQMACWERGGCLLVRRGQEVAHPGLFSWLRRSPAGAWNKSHRIAGASLSSARRLIAGGKCCVKISRAIEFCVLSRRFLFFSSPPVF